MVGVGVNVTEVPAQAVLDAALDAIVTDGVTGVVAVMVTVLLLAVVDVTQPPVTVSTACTVLPVLQLLLL